MLTRILNVTTSSRQRIECIRYKSHYRSMKFKPRPYDRRLYESAVKPVLPKEYSYCEQKRFVEDFVKSIDEYEPLELAEVRELQRIVKDNDYTVMTVCHTSLAVGIQIWLAKNQMRLHGMDLFQVEMRIGRKFMEDSPFKQLVPMMCIRSVIAFAKDITQLKLMSDIFAKNTFLTPLVYTIGPRIVTIPEANELTALPDIEMLRAQTVQILERSGTELAQSLSRTGKQLVAHLDAISNQQQQTTS